jgi:phosphate transport system substrate-binding protein
MGTVRRLRSPRRWAAAALVLAVLSLVGCAAAGNDAAAGQRAGQAAGTQAADLERGPAARVVSIKNIGSDTLVNLALAWAEAYMAAHHEVHISVTGGGSGTGIAALLNRTIPLANASRAMSGEELASARAEGFQPVQHTVALDAIAVVVNPANPVDRLTMPQIADIYTGRIRRWSEVGGEDRPIVLLSRESNSGTYVYFIERVIRLGRKDNRDLPSPETLLMPSSEGISAEVRQNPNAIGYDGLGYVTRDQKVVAVAAEEGRPYVLPEAATVLDGSYPIARPLYMYTAGEPQGAIAAYLSWILGEGQALIEELGFVPLTGRESAADGEAR